MSTSTDPDDMASLALDVAMVPSEAQAETAGMKRNGRPPFPLSGWTHCTWREQALTRVAELRTLLERFREHPSSSLRIQPTQLDKAIEGHLQEATQAAEGMSWWHSVRNAATMKRVTSNLDAAEAGLLRRAPKEYLCGDVVIASPSAIIMSISGLLTKRAMTEEKSSWHRLRARRTDAPS